MSKELDWENKTININSRRLNHLRYEDDAVIMFDNYNDIQQMLKELQHESQNVGLQLKQTKGKL